MSRTAFNSYTVSQARDYIVSRLPTLTTETVRIRDAVGRILAQDIRSPLDMPAYDNSAMDGFAFHHDVLTETDAVQLPIAGESLAGHPYTQSVPLGSCIRITTGALVPDGCDTVIPWERTESTDRHVCFAPGAVRSCANVRMQGENIAKGQIVLPKGTRIEPLHVGLLASIGVAEIPTCISPKVAVIATGDELLQPGTPYVENRIYNANTDLLIGLLNSMHVDYVDFGALKDDARQVRDTLSAAAEQCDLILITGGAADSKADISQQVIRELGQIADWTIFMRPGHPMRFAQICDVPAFILPGNPVAAGVTFLEFARGALLHMQGAETIWPETSTAVTTVGIKKKSGRAEFVRARVAVDEHNRCVVTPVQDQGSASLLPLAQADVIIALDHNEEAQAGDVVTIHRLDRLVR